MGFLGVRQPGCRFSSRHPVTTATEKRDQPQIPQHLQLLPNLRLNVVVRRMESRPSFAVHVNVGLQKFLFVYLLAGTKARLV